MCIHFRPKKLVVSREDGGIWTCDSFIGREMVGGVDWAPSFFKMYIMPFNTRKKKLWKLLSEDLRSSQCRNNNNILMLEALIWHSIQHLQSYALLIWRQDQVMHYHPWPCTLMPVSFVQCVPDVIAYSEHPQCGWSFHSQLILNLLLKLRSTLFVLLLNLDN